MKISDVQVLNNRLSIAFLIYFLVALTLSIFSCPLGMVIASSTDEIIRPLQSAITSGRPRWPYMLYSEAISAAFDGIAAGILFWVASLVLAYFFELRITKPILWLAIAIVSFCFGIWYYFLMPDVVPILQNEPLQFIPFLIHSGISGFITGGTQWVYLRREIPRPCLWIISSTICYLLFGSFVFWFSPEN